MTTLNELRQTVDIAEITRQVKRRRVGKVSSDVKEKPNYLGVCFFDGHGDAWLTIDGDTRCIGKEKDVREACKKYNTDIENPSDVKNTMIRWRREGWVFSASSSDVAKCEVLKTEKSQSHRFPKTEQGRCKGGKTPISQPYSPTRSARGHGKSSISECKERQLVLV
jgi:hypothetical protein